MQQAENLYVSSKTVSKWETGVAHSLRYYTDMTTLRIYFACFDKVYLWIFSNGNINRIVRFVLFITRCKVID